MINEIILKQISEIENECFLEAWSYEGLRETFSYDYNRLYVETVGEQVVGYLIANVLGDETELLRIATPKGYRRQGIAQKLLNMYFEDTKDICTRYLLEVRKSNDIARQLYENNNYHAIALRKNYYSRPSEDAIIYERSIG